MGHHSGYVWMIKKTCFNSNDLLHPVMQPVFAFQLYVVPVTFGRWPATGTQVFITFFFMYSCSEWGIFTFGRWPATGTQVFSHFLLVLVFWMRKFLLLLRTRITLKRIGIRIRLFTLIREFVLLIWIQIQLFILMLICIRISLFLCRESYSKDPL